MTGLPQDEATRLTYRCVCGEAVPLSSGSADTIQCGKCERTIPLSLLDDPDATICPGGISVGNIEDDELIGQELGHFTIIERLGHGGMGAVYRALDEALQRYVAIKVIRRSKTGSGVSFPGVQRLLEEARAQARVNHPNVVHIYYVSRSEEQPFFAMELIDGPTLSERLESGPLAYPDIIRIARQTVAALKHSVKLGIVHGDIKPGNILLDGDLVRLADFGLARPASAKNNESTSGGTPSYMAPEICAGETMTAVSDQYSLGVMLFEMTFGRAPYTWEDQTLESRITAHRHAPVEFPAQWPVEFPAQWKDVLEKLLQKQPADRFEDFSALDQRLAAMQPIEQPQAGRMLRSFAWITDYLLFTALSGIAMLPTSLVQNYVLNQLLPFPQRALSFVLQVVSGLLAPYLLYQYHLRRGTSPGKKLFQIAIVDRHGLAPKRREVALRSIIAFAPLWVAALKYIFTGDRSVEIHVGDEQSSGQDGSFTTILAIVLILSWAVSVALAFFGSRRLAWHDRFFKTKVVLAGSNKAQDLVA